MDIIIRPAKPEDYPSFRRMEERAWAGSGVSVIPEDMFLTWLKIFPDGLRVAEKNGEICGHGYVQISDFNPSAKKDQRSWNEVTDYGYTTNTHNPNSNSVYVVSFSALGVGKKLHLHFLDLTRKYMKKYLVGACRMPGLIKYAQKKNVKMVSKSFVTEYARLVCKTAKEKDKKFFDPVLSVFASANGMRYFDVVKNYFNDRDSGNWACVLYFKNEF